MENRANYALIGAVILFAAVALLGVVMWMGQVQFSREYEDYNVVFDGPVNGLSEGAAVRYLGLKVGEVEELRIDADNDSRVIARIRIDSQTPVRTDSTAILDFVGLTGATFIQIQAGSQSADLVVRRPNTPIPVIPTETTQLSNLVSGGQQFMLEANTTLQRLNTLMSPDNIDTVSQTLVNVERFSAELVGEDGITADMRATLARVDSAAAQIEKAAASVSALAQSADNEIVTIGAEIEAAVVALRETTEELKVSLSAASDSLSETVEELRDPALGMLYDISQTGRQLQGLITRLDGLAREIESNPRGFVLGEPLPVRE